MADDTDLTRRLHNLEERLARIEEQLIGHTAAEEMDLDALDAEQRELVERWRIGETARKGLLNQYERQRVEDFIAEADAAAQKHQQLTERLNILQQEKEQLRVIERQRKQELQTQITLVNNELRQQWDGTGTKRYTSQQITVEDERARLAQDTMLRADGEASVKSGSEAVSDLRGAARAQIVDMVLHHKRPPQWFSIFLGDVWPQDPQKWMTLATNVLMLRWYAGITDPIVAILEPADRPEDQAWSRYELENAIVAGRGRAQETGSVSTERHLGLSL